MNVILLISYGKQVLLEIYPSIRSSVVLSPSNQKLILCFQLY